MTVHLHVTSQGEGESLLLLHGLFGSGGNWATLAQQFAPFYRVHSIDLRNHGGSPHTDSMSYPEMAADIVAFLEQQELEETNLLGHSLGGKVAMWLALHHGARVRRLLVVDIAPRAYPHDHGELISAMRKVDFSVVTRRQDVDTALQESVPDEGLRQFLLTNLRRRKDSWAWRINLDVIAQEIETLTGFPDGGEDTEPFTRPSLFVVGAHSDYVEASDHDLIRRLYPQAKLHTVERAGHWLHAEQPAVLMQLALEFFA